MPRCTYYVLVIDSLKSKAEVFKGKADSAQKILEKVKNKVGVSRKQFAVVTENTFPEFKEKILKIARKVKKRYIVVRLHGRRQQNKVEIEEVSHTHDQSSDDIILTKWEVKKLANALRKTK